MIKAEFAERYGPVALVTGASSGIGRAFAQRLAQAGLDMVLVSRRVDRLQALAAQLRQDHAVTAVVCEADLAQPDAVDSMVAATAGLDVGLVVSNAGFGFKSALQHTDPAGMARMLMVNCHAPTQLAHRFIPRLLARGKGGILFTSSVEGLLGCPYSTPYAASKAYVNSLAEGLWGELSPRGIDVLALCPGSTDTEAPALQGIDASTLAGLMQPGDVAGLALENLRNGPVYIAGELFQQMFAGLLAMPRREALLALGASMKQYSQ